MLKLGEKWLARLRKSPLESSAENRAPEVWQDPARPPSLISTRGAVEVGLVDAVMSGWYRQPNEVFRGVAIGPDDTVVDVGCGDGGNSVFCAERGAHVIAVDVDPQVIEGVSTRLAAVGPGTHETRLSDGHALPVDDGTASRVLCTEVLEHVADPEQLMRELYRIGKPGALYLLTVPDALQENLQKLVAPPIYFQAPNHIRIIEREEFPAMVERAGLVIEEQTQSGFYWSIWWALFWGCGVGLEKPQHPVLDRWTETWQALMEMPQGKALKEKLDTFMPKCRIIVARKP